MFDAMKHDIEMERKYKGTSTIKNCVKIAAKELHSKEEDTYVVMFAFVLGGYKAFCSSNKMNAMGVYVEVVYNDEKDEFYAINYGETNRKTYKLEEV